MSGPRVRSLAAVAGSPWPLWRDRRGEIEVRFAGRGATDDRRTVLDAAGGGEVRLAWLSQVHSAEVVRAEPGCSGEADALWTGASGLALTIATADCVPLVLGRRGRVAAVHAGWRGIAGGIAARAVAALGGPPAATAAWLGPAIGPCCYEVGAEVARRVVAASGPVARRAAPAGSGRPHLDLHAAVAWQLAAAGVAGPVARVAECTRCSPSRLWSWRRDGAAAGRNLAFVWRREPTVPGDGGR